LTKHAGGAACDAAGARRRKKRRSKPVWGSDDVMMRMSEGKGK
jgi:hypothetical protein